MVSAVHFVATSADEHALLDHLGEPSAVQLLPWPVADLSEPPIERAALAAHRDLTVVSTALGPPDLVAVPGTVTDPDPVPPVGILAKFRRSAPVPPLAGTALGLIDTNRSSVLLWQRGDGDGLSLGEIGSQADAMSPIGADYVRWVNRTMGWVRRRGTKVWGLERSAVRPDLDIELGTVSAVYALPGALARLESGARLRWP